ncbi:Cupin domain [Mollivirus sibericum]|uniref:Cupin domain n=1 Tax=Mollivirus sibericum TaxID=1678078 RepID=UPI0006B2EC76|nr:Cupin domain [Mollivirus sibericum]ALD62181.1 Cupin domain [Mollivirus sibericum]
MSAPRPRPDPHQHGAFVMDDLVILVEPRTPRGSSDLPRRIFGPLKDVSPLALPGDRWLAPPRAPVVVPPAAAEDEDDLEQKGLSYPLLGARQLVFRAGAFETGGCAEHFSATLGPLCVMPPGEMLWERIAVAYYPMDAEVVVEANGSRHIVRPGGSILVRPGSRHLVFNASQTRTATILAVASPSGAFGFYAEASLYQAVVGDVCLVDNAVLRRIARAFGLCITPEDSSRAAISVPDTGLTLFRPLSGSWGLEKGQILVIRRVSPSPPGPLPVQELTLGVTIAGADASSNCEPTGGALVNQPTAKANVINAFVMSDPLSATPTVLFDGATTITLLGDDDHDRQKASLMAVVLTDATYGAKFDSSLNTVFLKKL